MEIILLERIEKLGTIGDVVNVKDGYARNFLLPNKKALRANEANRKVFEANRERLETENAARRDEAAKAGADVDGTELVLIRSSSNSGQLYGSVNVRDIAEALKEKGFDINKSQIVLERPIKTIGMFDVRVALHPEVHVTVKANVARSDDEAELQRQGVDVLGQVPRQFAVGDIALHEAEAPVGAHLFQVRQVAGVGQQIECDHLIVGRRCQHVTHVCRSDESGGAGNEDAHELQPPECFSAVAWGRGSAANRGT